MIILRFYVNIITFFMNSILFTTIKFCQFHNIASKVYLFFVVISNIIIIIVGLQFCSFFNTTQREMSVL